MPVNFKSFLQKRTPYEGGKSKKEIQIETGKKLYKLSSNENPLGAAPKALEAIRNQLDHVSEYPDRTDTRLRAALSAHYKGQLQEDQFVTANSGVAMIEMIIQGFMEEGTHCIYSNPAFGPYQAFPEKIGAEAIDVPLLGESFDLDVSGILQAINEQTRLVFITSPNNPTGNHLPKSQINELIEKLPDHVILVFDEVYFQFPDAPDYIRALPYVLKGKNVIGVNSFSKAYGLAGLRVGYAYSTPEISTYLHNLRRPFMINSLSMEAAIAALGDNEFIERTVSLIHTEKEFLYGRLDKLGVKYWKTQANFLLIKPPVPPIAFESRLLKEGVMVRPVENFGAPGCVRVTIGTRPANEAFLGALEKVIFKS